MKSLGIRTYGEKVLRTKSETVNAFDAELERLCERMNETMIVERGVGLAANQVGITRQVAVVNPEPDEGDTLLIMVNPRIVAASDELVKLEEGCLSVPGVRGEVARHAWVDVVYQNEKGKERRLRAEGMLARIIQHELDHLNGVLFIDRLSLAKRSLVKSKLKGLTRGDRET